MPNVSYDTKLDSQSDHTHIAYNGLDGAYKFFNERLFSGSLPFCLITLQRKKGSYGYFSPNRFAANELKTDEIALNPLTFLERTTEQVLSTLAHEMVHLWQQHFGKPGRGNYHNQQWADKMVNIGLEPQDHKTGKQVGQHVSHSIAANGRFASVCADFLAQGPITLYSDCGISSNAKKKSKKNKIKYTCLDCSSNVWGKPDMLIQCVECESRFIPETQAEQEPEALAA